MTYLKTTSIAMALAAILGAGSAFAGDTPPTFSDLDTDANGQVSFSEFAKYKEKEGKTLTNAQRQFNVISGGSESFSAEQYEKSFAVKGEVDARETDSVVVMPSDSTAVKGAVDSGVIVDEFDETPDADPQAQDAQIQDEQSMSDDAMETETESMEMDEEPVEAETMDTESTMETDPVDADATLDTETDVQTETDVETDIGLEENEIALDPDVPSAFETTTDSDVQVETGVEGDAILQTDPALESPTLENPALENEVMSDTETTIDSPQVEGSDLNIDPTVDAVTGENDTSYETEFSVPEAPETPTLDETDPVVESEMESDVELQENMTLEEDSDVDLDIKSDVETDLESESDPN
ncbi:hypothetical protein [Litorimonas sp.]|uniref:hypothetical protein n=1 Tax=Litorimonas sp. TaxID=1892381 RepID=UPI003A8A1EF7